MVFREVPVVLERRAFQDCLDRLVWLVPQDQRVIVASTVPPDLMDCRAPRVHKETRDVHARSNLTT